MEGKFEICYNTADGQSIIITLKQTKDNEILPTLPIIRIEPNFTDEEIISAFFDAARHSMDRLPYVKAAYWDCESPVEIFYEVKGEANAERGKKFVHVELSGNSITFWPTKKQNNYYLYLQPIVCDISNPTEVVEALESAIAISTTDSYCKTIELKDIGLPYKSSWLAVKDADNDKLARIFLEGDVKSVQCQYGLGEVFGNHAIDYALILPRVNKWTIIASFQAFALCYYDVEDLIRTLSLEFSEAHAYSTNRIVEYHQWMKASAGNIKRSFAYLGETGERMRDKGRISRIEKEIGYSKTDEVWAPNEQDVVKICEAWSINPMLQLWGNDEIGILGEFAFDQAKRKL